MPYDANTPVARCAARFPARLVPPAHLSDPPCPLTLQLRSPQRLVNRHPHGVELVIACHFLDQFPAAVVIEDDEVPYQGEESRRLEYALQHHLKLGHVGVGQGLACDRSPRLEPFPARVEGANAGLEPIGDHQRLVHGEEGGKLRRVGLKLLPGGPDGCVLVDGVLQLYDSQGQAVDEQHDVRPAGIPVLRDGELVDGEEAVVGGVVEVDDADMRPANGAVLRSVLHRNAVDEHAVEGAVSGLQGGSIWVGQSA